MNAGAGFGERSGRPNQAMHLFAEVAASSDATLEVRDTMSGERYQFDLIRVVPGQELEARQGRSRIEVLEREIQKNAKVKNRLAPLTDLEGVLG